MLPVDNAILINRENLIALQWSKRFKPKQKLVEIFDFNYWISRFKFYRSTNWKTRVKNYIKN